MKSLLWEVLPIRIKKNNKFIILENYLLDSIDICLINSEIKHTQKVVFPFVT